MVHDADALWQLLWWVLRVHDRPYSVAPPAEAAAVLAAAGGAWAAAAALAAAAAPPPQLPAPAGATTGRPLVMRLHAEPRAATAAAGAPGAPPLVVYHGSQLKSWPSILRHGLQELSNTRHMAIGAVHGPGVYTALDAAIAWGYAASGYIVRCELDADAASDPARATHPGGYPGVIIVRDVRALRMTHLLLRESQHVLAADAGAAGSFQAGWAEDFY